MVGLLPCAGKGPGAAVLQQLPVFVVRVAHGPVREEGVRVSSFESAASAITAVMAPWMSVSHTTGMTLLI